MLFCQGISSLVGQNDRCAYFPIDLALQGMLGLGLGTVGAIGSAVQAGTLSTLRTDVDAKATSTDLTTANTKITALETTVGTLSTSSTSSTTWLGNVCTNVSLG